MAMIGPQRACISQLRPPIPGFAELERGDGRRLECTLARGDNCRSGKKAKGRGYGVAWPWVTLPARPMIKATFGSGEYAFAAPGEDTEMVRSYRRFGLVIALWTSALFPGRHQA